MIYIYGIIRLQCGNSSRFISRSFWINHIYRQLDASNKHLDASMDGLFRAQVKRIYIRRSKMCCFQYNFRSSSFGSLDLLRNLSIMLLFLGSLSRAHLLPRSNCVTQFFSIFKLHISKLCSCFSIVLYPSLGKMNNAHKIQVRGSQQQWKSFRLKNPHFPSPQNHLFILASNLLMHNSSKLMFDVSFESLMKLSVAVSLQRG